LHGIEIVLRARVCVSLFIFKQQATANKTTQIQHKNPTAEVSKKNERLVIKNVVFKITWELYLRDDWLFSLKRSREHFFVKR